MIMGSSCVKKWFLKKNAGVLKSGSVYFRGQDCLHLDFLKPCLRRGSTLAVVAVDVCAMKTTRLQFCMIYFCLGYLRHWPLLELTLKSSVLMSGPTFLSSISVQSSSSLSGERPMPLLFNYVTQGLKEMLLFCPKIMSGPLFRIYD